MPSLIVMRGSDRMGPYPLQDIADLIDEGVLLPEDACAPEDRPSQIRPISWWLATMLKEDGTGKPSTPETAPERESQAWRQDPLLDGRMPLGGDTPVCRGDPPSHSTSDPNRRERQLYRGRPTVLAYGKSLFLIIILASGAVFANNLGPPWTAALLTLLTLSLCLLAIHRYTRLYLVTNRRVELLEGLIAKSSREVRIQDIRAINVSRKGLLGLLGVGTVEFASAGSGDVEVAFEKVWNAARLKHLVRQLQEAAPGDFGRKA